jgi:GrpE
VIATGSRGSIVAVALVSLLGAVVAFVVVWSLTPTQAAAVPPPAASNLPEPPATGATPSLPTPPVSTSPVSRPQSATELSGAQETPTIPGSPANQPPLGVEATSTLPEPPAITVPSVAAQTSPAAAGGAATSPIVSGPTSAAPSSTLVPAVWSAVIAGLTGVLAAAALMVARSRGPRGATPQPAGGTVRGTKRGPGPPLEAGPPLPDAHVSALIAQRQDFLMQRTALLRGLADLLARLPKEFAWQAQKLLEAAGARKLEPRSGAPFDPAAHQVIDTVATDDVRHDDTVAHLLRAGWTVQDQVLVPAHVLVYALAEHRSLDGPR